MSTSAPMPRWAKVLIVVGVLLGVVIGLAISSLRVLQGMLEYGVSAVAFDLPQSHVEGQEWGATHDEASCIEEGLVRAMPCADPMLCPAAASLFTHGCLAAAAETTETCAAVPALDDRDGMRTWAVQSCEARGLGNAPNCVSLFEQGVARYCAGDGPGLGQNPQEEGTVETMKSE